jgi:magnesium-transporting ATPase (P-type)
MAGTSGLKAAGNFCLGLVVIAAGFMLFAVLIRGMVWASEKALPWLTHAATIALIACVLVLLPLCIFKATRPWAGLGYYAASYLFGTVLFAFSCVVVVQIWGKCTSSVSHTEEVTSPTKAHPIKNACATGFSDGRHAISIRCGKFGMTDAALLRRDLPIKVPQK